MYKQSGCVKIDDEIWQSGIDSSMPIEILITIKVNDSFGQSCGYRFFHGEPLECSTHFFSVRSGFGIRSVCCDYFRVGRFVMRTSERLQQRTERVEPQSGESAGKIG